MSEQARDLKTMIWFTLSLNALGDLRTLEVKRPALTRSTSTFIVNCKRALQTAMFPEGMFAAGRNFQLAESIAFLEKTGSLLPKEPKDRGGPTVPTEVASRRDEILDGKCEPWVKFLMHGPVYHEQVIRAAEKRNVIPIFEGSCLPLPTQISVGAAAMAARVNVKHRQATLLIRVQATHLS